MANEERVLFLNVDNVYGADELGLPYRDICKEGVVDWNGGDFAVSQRAAGANMSVDVAAGACWIKGDDDADLQPTYRYREPATTNVVVTAADVTNPRVDRVVAEVLDDTFTGTSKLGRIRVIAGTPSAGANLTNLTGAAAVPNTALLLANVLVAAGDTAINTADIKDMRKPAYLGRPIPVTNAEFTTLSAAADSTWDGLEVELEADATNGVYWRFRYRAASGSTYKWEFVGGPPMEEENLATETWAGAGYTDIANSGPDLTIPRTGYYDIEFSAEVASNNVEYLFVTPKIGSAAAIDNDSARSYQDPVGSNRRQGRSIRRLITANDLVRLNYKRGTAASGVATVMLRNLKITPVRVS